MKKTYAVTGGTGYIGSKLLEKLSEDKDNHIYAIIRWTSQVKVERDNIEYVFFDGTEKSIEKILAESDYLIHLAALYTVRDDEESTKRLLSANVLFSTLLFNVANRVNKNLVISTASTFSSLNEEGTYAPSTLYAATKSAVETIAHYYNDLSVHFLTFPDTYGPGDWRSKIHNILAKNKEWPFQFKSPANQEMRIMHVDDIIGHLLASLDDNSKGVHIHDIYTEAELLTLETLAKEVTENECLFNNEGQVVKIPKFAREGSKETGYKNEHPQFKWEKK